MLQRYKISLIVVNLNKGKIINILPYISDCDFYVDLRTLQKKIFINKTVEFKTWKNRLLNYSWL